MSQLLDSVYENGCTNWDTADIYGNSEVVIGKWYESSMALRTDVFIYIVAGSRRRGRGTKYSLLQSLVSHRPTRTV